MTLRLCGDVWLVDGVQISIDTVPDGDESPELILANLETPLLRYAVPPRPKAGPTVRGNLAAVPRLVRSLYPLCLSLANNHAMDYGPAGLQQTMELCQAAHVATVGAGVDLYAAQSPVICVADGMRIGILARCETQFGAASAWRAGVAAIEPSVHEMVRKLKAEVDIVVVSVHGASEMSPWPSPRWQDLLRSFVDAGATIVHGHHGHVPQGYETYEGGVIFYGLGNFLADPRQWTTANTCWSVVADCDLLSGNLPYSVKTAVISDQEGGAQVRWSDEQEARQHATYLSKCNQPLQDRALLSGIWQQVSMHMYRSRYGLWLGFEAGNLIQVLFHRLAKWRRWLSKQVGNPVADVLEADRRGLLLKYNLLACESHIDAIVTALGIQSGELEDLRTVETANLVNEMMLNLKEVKR